MLNNVELSNADVVYYLRYRNQTRKYYLQNFLRATKSNYIILDRYTVFHIFLCNSFPILLIPWIYPLNIIKGQQYFEVFFIQICMILSPICAWEILYSLYE